MNFNVVMEVASQPTFNVMVRWIVQMPPTRIVVTSRCLIVLRENSSVVAPLEAWVDLEVGVFL